MIRSINDVLVELAEREFFPKLPSRCHVAESMPIPHYERPNGRAAVMQDKMVEFLSKAAKYYDSTGSHPMSKYIVLKADNLRMTGSILVNGVYTTLPFHVGANIDCSFECAVRLADLRELLSIVPEKVKRDKYNNPVFKANSHEYSRVKINERPERVDLMYNYSSMILTVRYGTSVARLNCIAIDMQDEPVLMEREYSKEEKAEFTWLKKSLNKPSATRYTAEQTHYIYVDEIADQNLMLACNGFCLFVSKNHTSELDLGYIDVFKLGEVDGPLKYIDYRTVTDETTGYRVRVNRELLIRNVKAAMKVADTTQFGESVIELDFREYELTVTGESPELGISRNQIRFQQDISAHVLTVNGKFILDALSGNKDEMVTIQFNKVYGEAFYITCGAGRGAWIAPMKKRDYRAKPQPPAQPADEIDGEEYETDETE